MGFIVKRYWSTTPTQHAFIILLMLVNSMTSHN